MKNEIRSVQFIDTYFPHIDGVVRTVHNYATLMGCPVIAPKSPEPYEDHFPYPVLRTPEVRIPFIGYSYPIPELSVATRRRLLSSQCDIYHAHSPFMLGKYARVLATKQRIPIVATFHSKYYDDFKRITKSAIIAKQLTATVVDFYRSVDEVWTVSEGAAETLHSYGYEGDIFIMENGTDYVLPENPAAAEEEARRRYHLPQGKKLILYVGQLVWQKNIKMILDAARLLRNESDDYRFLFVGTGYYKKQITEYAEKLDLWDCVRFLGQISDPEKLKGVYLASDLFFFPSEYDTFSLVVREAAAMGLPSLLVTGSNAAEAVRDGENGYLAAPTAQAMAARIKSIFSKEGQIEAVGTAAQQTIPVKWESIIPRVKERYAHIIENYGRK